MDLKLGKRVVIFIGVKVPYDKFNRKQFRLIKLYFSFSVGQFLEFSVIL